MTPEELRDLLQNDPLRAASTVQALADQGVLAAQLLFGRMLLEGIGCAKSPAAAFAWFQRAAADDHAEAINMLGRCLENGWAPQLTRSGPSGATRAPRSSVTMGAIQPGTHVPRWPWRNA